MNVVSNFKNDSNSSEAFPFFDLPDLVISKILKEYVPVNDKVDTLSQIPEFEPYVSRKSIWYRSSLKMFHLAKSLKPGWYVDYDNLHNRYYVSIDYVNLNFTIHSFCSRYPGFQTYLYTENLNRPLSHVEAVVETFNWINLTPVERNDVLVYHWSTLHPFRNVFVWIFRSLNIVRTSFSAIKYPFEKNKSIIFNECLHKHSILLTLKDDLSVVFHCETCGDLSCPKCINKPQNENVVLPLIFRVCNKIDPTEFSKCKCIVNSTRIMYAVSKLTFTEFEKENVLVLNSHFIKTMSLASYNIISTWCHNLERGSHWLRAFLRLPFHKYKLPH